jgi:hypothetical protein
VESQPDHWKSAFFLYKSRTAQTSSACNVMVTMVVKGMQRLARNKYVGGWCQASITGRASRDSSRLDALLGVASKLRLAQPEVRVSGV